MNLQRMYEVVAINEKSKAVVVLSARPVTHDEGCVWLTKITSHPARRVQLREVVRLN